MSSQESQIASPADATSAVTFHPTHPSRLLTAGWDSTVHLYSAPFTPGPGPVATFAHPAPVLDVTFGTGRSEGKAYSGCLDGGIRELSLEEAVGASASGDESSVQRVIGVHDQAVKCTSWSTSHHLLLAASWAKTLTIHDPRLSAPSSSSLKIPNLPGKVFAMDVTDDKVVVAMSSRKVYIYDLRQCSQSLQSSAPSPQQQHLPLPWQERESSLKFMTRSVKCMPNGRGYASSSIEGRVAVEFFDPSEESQAKKYAFKCHRQLVDGVDTVFPVNTLAFHPTHGTFATGGGDGAVVIWDPTAKKRLRQLPKQPASISSIAFNADGTQIAIACSVMEEEGTATATTTAMATAADVAPPKNAIIVRQVGDDCQPRSK